MNRIIKSRRNKGCLSPKVLTTKYEIAEMLISVAWTLLAKINLAKNQTERKKAVKKSKVGGS